MPRPSSKDEKLALALQLAGLQQQQEQADARQSSDRLHQALALMGLMQQSKSEEAQRAFQQQQLAQTGEFHRGELQNQQQQQTQQGQWHDQSGQEFQQSLAQRDKEFAATQTSQQGQRDMTNWQAGDESARAWAAQQEAEKQHAMTNWAATDESQRGWNAQTEAAKSRDMTNWSAEDTSARGWQALLDDKAKAEEKAQLDAFGELNRTGDRRAFSLLPERFKAMDQPRHQAEVDAWANQLYPTMKALPPDLLAASLGKVHPDVAKKVIGMVQAQPHAAVTPGTTPALLDASRVQPYIPPTRDFSQVSPVDQLAKDNMKQRLKNLLMFIGAGQPQIPMQ